MKLEYGGAGEIPSCKVKCDADRFENEIRSHGVQFACEWFGHEYDGEVAKETIRILLERSGVKP